MADGYIDIDVRLDGSLAERQADALGRQLGQQVQQGVDSAGKAAGSSTRQALGNIGGTLTAFGTAYSKSVTLPIAAAATAAGVSAVKIDTALTGVRKTVDGTEQDYEALKEAAIEFSKTNAVDPAQILDIQALGAQLGYTIDELDMFGEVVSGLDIATNMQADEAATELAQFANIMGMAHDETKNYGSTIVDLGNNFATTEADISHMAMRIAGAGKQIGMSEADVLGLATALSSMGIEAEAGGTAISTIMSNIDKAVATNSESLELWAQAAGMSAEQFSKAWGEDAVGALSSVLVGMDAATQSGGNMSLMLEELGIGSIRQTDTLKRLANNSEFLGKAVDTANQAWEENVALDKEVANRNASMASQLQILWNRVQAVATEAGGPLVNALIDVIDAAQPLVDALASGAQAFADLDEAEQKTVLAAVGIVAAFGPVTGIFGKVLSTTRGMSDGWRSLSANMRTISDSAKAANATIAAGTGTWTRYISVGEGANKQLMRWDRSTQSYVKTNNTLRASLATTTIGTKAQAAAQVASNAAMKAGSAVARTLGGALKTIAPIAVITGAVALFTSLSSAIKESAENAKLHDEATRGLEAAASGLNVQINAEGDAFASLAQTANAVDVKAIAEQHRELADSISETSQNAANSQGMLTQYNGAIQELAGRSDLTEIEVAKLKLAVDGVNESCGTSYTVAQDAGGAYQVMADGAVVAKDSVYELIEAQKAQIRAEAEAENYKAAYKQLAEDQKAVADATTLVAQKQEEYNRALSDMNQSWSPEDYADGTVASYQAIADAAEEGLNTAKEALSDVSEQAGSTQSSLNRLEEQQVLTSMAMEQGASSVIKAADANLAYKAGVQGIGVNLVEFTNALINMGFTAEQVSSMTAEQAISMAQGWQGGLGSMIEATINAGIEVPAHVKEMTGISAAEFDSLAASAGISGASAMGAFAQAIADGAITANTSSAQVRDIVNQRLGETDGLTPASNAMSSYSGRISQEAPVSGAAAASNRTAASEALPFDGKAKASGISDYSGRISREVPLSRSAGTANANAAGSGLQSNNRNAGGWGSHLVENFAAGISGAIGFVTAAVNAVASVAANILGHSIPKEGILREGGRGEAVWGQHLVENIAEGMTSRKARQAIRQASKDVAVDLNRELSSELSGVTPMAQMQQSVIQGASAFNMSAMTVGAAPSYTTNNQNLSFYGDYASPDIISREMRMQQHYGLAGRFQ